VIPQIEQAQKQADEEYVCGTNVVSVDRDGAEQE